MEEMTAARSWQLGLAGKLDGVMITYRAWMACQDERRALEVRMQRNAESVILNRRLEELQETEGTRRGQYMAARADAVLWIAQNPAPAAAVAEVRASAEGK